MTMFDQEVNRFDVFDLEGSMIRVSLDAASEMAGGGAGLRVS